MPASEHRRRVRCERCGAWPWDDDGCACEDLDDDELAALEPRDDVDPPDWWARDEDWRSAP